MWTLTCIHMHLHEEKNINSVQINHTLMHKNNVSQKRMSSVLFNFWECTE